MNGGIFYGEASMSRSFLFAPSTKNTGSTATPMPGPPATVMAEQRAHGRRPIGVDCSGDNDNCEGNLVRAGVLRLARRRLTAGFGAAAVERRVILCTPRDTCDLFPILQTMYPQTTPEHPSILRPAPHVVETLGRLTQASLRQTPLLIVLPIAGPSTEQDPLDAKPTFIELATVQKLRDEVELNETCTFALEFKAGHAVPGIGATLRLKATFSLDYLGWVRDMREALEKIKPVKEGSPGPRTHKRGQQEEPRRATQSPPQRPPPQPERASSTPSPGPFRNNKREEMERARLQKLTLTSRASSPQLSTPGGIGSGGRSGSSLANVSSANAPIDIRQPAQPPPTPQGQLRSSEPVVPPSAPFPSSTPPHAPASAIAGHEEPQMERKTTSRSIFRERPPPSTLNVDRRSRPKMPSLRRISWQGELGGNDFISELAKEWAEMQLDDSAPNSAPPVISRDGGRSFAQPYGAHGYGPQQTEASHLALHEEENGDELCGEEYDDEGSTVSQAWSTAAAASAVSDFSFVSSHIGQGDNATLIQHQQQYQQQQQYTAPQRRPPAFVYPWQMQTDRRLRTFYDQVETARGASASPPSGNNDVQSVQRERATALANAQQRRADEEAQTRPSRSDRDHSRGRAGTPPCGVDYATDTPATASGSLGRPSVAAISAAAAKDSRPMSADSGFGSMTSRNSSLDSTSAKEQQQQHQRTQDRAQERTGRSKSRTRVPMSSSPVSPQQDDILPSYSHPSTDAGSSGSRHPSPARSTQSLPRPSASPVHRRTRESTPPPIRTSNLHTSSSEQPVGRTSMNSTQSSSVFHQMFPGASSSVSTVESSPQSRRMPVMLPGSPLGSPCEIREMPKPVISLADARGPRVWSVRRQRWVKLYEKVREWNGVEVSERRS